MVFHDLKNHRKGQVLVIASLALVIFSVALAFAIDAGHLVLAAARLQNVSDASTLGAAQVLLQEHTAGTEEEDARAAAEAEALRLRDANWPEAGLEVEFGVLDANGDFVAADTSTPATAVRCRSFRNPDAPGGPLNLAFAHLLGVDSASPAARSTSQVASSIYGVLSGLRPFAIPQDALVPPGQQMNFYPAGGGGPGHGQAMVAPGCWGLLNLDGGACGTPELRDWIRNGYDEPVIIDPAAGHRWFDGTPGFRAALQQAVNDIIGETSYMVIYDQVTGQGSNGQFRCVGFLRATVTSCQMTGGNPHMTCRVEEVEDLHDILAGQGHQSPNVRKIQIVD